MLGGGHEPLPGAVHVAALVVQERKVVDGLDDPRRDRLLVERDGCCVAAERPQVVRDVEELLGVLRGHTPERDADVFRCIHVVVFAGHFWSMATP